jgi:hypothetical protein
LGLKYQFWIKCNIDGAALGSPGLAAYDGLFRDFNGDCFGYFAEGLGGLGTSSALSWFNASY